jgi:hypothetical protein
LTRGPTHNLPENIDDESFLQYYSKKIKSYRKKKGFGDADKLANFLCMGDELIFIIEAANIENPVQLHVLRTFLFITAFYGTKVFVYYKLSRDKRTSAKFIEKFLFYKDLKKKIGRKKAAWECLKKFYADKLIDKHYDFFESKKEVTLKSVAMDEGFTR